VTDIHVSVQKSALEIYLLVQTVNTNF